MSPLMTILFYTAAAALLFAFEEGYFAIARRYGIVDKPNARSSHSRVTLRGGGVIFYIAALMYFVVSDFSYPLFMTGLTIVAVISFIDDIHSVANRLRALLQFAALALMFWQLGMTGDLPWWGVIIGLVVATGIVNAYNFMDGINGITGMYSLAILVPVWVENRMLEFIDPRLIVLSAIGVAVFLFYNFRNRARCFAGDVGSVSIAYIMLFLVGALIVATGQLYYLLFFAVYGADSILTIVHRMMLHENIFKPHRKHAYQLLANELHWSHRSVSALYGALQLAISFGLIYWPGNRWLYFCGVIALLLAAYVIFKRKYYHLHADYLARQAASGQ